MSVKKIIISSIPENGCTISTLIDLVTKQHDCNPQFVVAETLWLKRQGYLSLSGMTFKLTDRGVFAKKRSMGHEDLKA